MTSPTPFPGSGVAFAGPISSDKLNASPIVESPSNAPQSASGNTKTAGPTDPSAAQLEVLAALVELLGIANRAERFDQACEAVSGAFRDWIRAARVDIAWQNRPLSTCKWIAGAGTSIDEGEHVVSARDAAADEVLIRGGIADSNAVTSRDRIALLAVKRYRDAAKSRRVFGLALDPFAESSASEPRRSGVLLLRFDRPISENEAVSLIARLEVCRGPLGKTLARLAESEPTRLGQFWRTTKKRIRTRQIRIALGCLLAGLGILAVPTPYRMGVDCELQPTSRRYIAAPIAAPLQSVHVRPGDDVRTGDMLAMLDPREIEMELAAKRAELERTRQEHKGLLAQHKSGESRLAALQVQRLESERDLLEHRRQRLELQSPIDGMVVSGDWQRSEGVLLERGETMFEIAPLGTFRIEILIDESDVLSLRTGMPLTFRLDALPGEVFRANVERIHPRAELRNGKNVFLAEATLQDSEGRLRPGMRGRGRIRADRHLLGWNLFHKAYYRTAVMLGGT
ncbi:MAG: efflux RND transporter periplasmic adaptor subunit [Planctomycetota bacterium]